MMAVTKEQTGKAQHGAGDRVDPHIRQRSTLTGIRYRAFVIFVIGEETSL